MQLQSGTVVDRYTVERPLGSGGMASVFLARHVQIGSLHALKVLTIPSPEIRARLLQEGRVQGGVRHPNIVAVTDAIEVGGAPALVLEYVDGPSLAELLPSRPLTLPQVDALARGILRGVAAAHRNGLIHRDLKPANVLLALTDGIVVPKITDFGLVKVLAAQAGATRSGVGLGTPSYMAPEQIRDAASVDARADVFALGAILQELLTGRRAFDGPDMYAIFQAICDGRRAPFADGDLPPRMANAIDRALATDPADRFADAPALLDAWMGGTPDPVGAWDEDTVTHARDLRPLRPAGFVPQRTDPTYGLTLEPPVDAGETLAPDSLPNTGETLAPDRISATGQTIAPPVEPWGRREAAPWLVGGILVCGPFVYGFARAAFGDAMEGAGGPLWPLLGVATVAFAALVTLGRGELAGRTHATATWLIGPAVVALAGAIGTSAGALATLATPRTASAGEGALVIAWGISEATSVELIGTALTAVLLLLTSLCVVGVHVLRLGVHQRIDALQAAIGLLGFAGGLGMWFVSERTWSGGPAPFLVFVILVGAAAAIAWAARAVDRGERATGWRVIVLLGALFAVGAAAQAVYLQEQLWWFRQFAADAPMDRLIAAEHYLAEQPGVGSIPTVLGWFVAAAVLVGVALLGDRLPLRRPVRALLPVAGLVVLVLAASIGAATLRRESSERIVPAFLEEAAWWQLGVGLVDRPEGVVVTGGRAPLQAGDVVLAVESRPQGSVQELVRALRACGCGSGEACDLRDGCLSAGDPVALTVRRGEARDARLVDLSVPLANHPSGH